MKLKWSHIYKGLFIVIPSLILLMFVDYYRGTPKTLHYKLHTETNYGHVDKYIIHELEYGDDTRLRLDDTLTSYEIVDLVTKLNKSIK
jgi:hypothetical protein